MSDTAAPRGKPPFFSRQNMAYQVYRFKNKPEIIIGVLCLAFLSFVVLVPLFQIIKDAFTFQSYDLAYQRDGEVGAFTLLHFDRVFNQPISRALFVKPLINSLKMGFAVTLIAIFVGSSLAWLMVRTNVHFKGVFGAMLVFPYMMPSWVMALAWLSLFKNDRIGGSEGLLTYLTSVQMPDWVAYGYVPIVFTLAMHYYAYTYLLLWESLTLIPGNYSLSNLTTYFWVGQGNVQLAYGEPGVIHNKGILGALGNSVKLGFMAALSNGALGLLVGYAVVRGRGAKLARWLEGIAFAPYIFPSSALGAIYIGMFSTNIGPVPALYGTFTILVLITVIKNLPFTSRTGIAAMLQIHQSLEETARVQGIGWFRRMFRIIIPLSMSGLVAGMLLTFITAMRELSLIILLISPGNMVLTGVIFGYQEQDMAQHSSAVTLMLVLIIITISVIVRLLSRGAGVGRLNAT